MSSHCNEEFWDLPPEIRADRMQRAATLCGEMDFYDLPPEERAAAYEGVCPRPIDG